MNSRLREEIRSILIEENFEPELIAVEYGIPVSEVIEIKNEINNNSKRIPIRSVSMKNVARKRPEIAYSRIGKMKSKYNFEFEKSYGIDSDAECILKMPSKEDEEEIKRFMDDIYSEIDNLNEWYGKDQSDYMISVFDKMKTIDKTKYTLESACKMYNLISKGLVENATCIVSSVLMFLYKERKKELIKRITDIINYKVKSSNNLDELRYLNSLLTPEMSKDNYVEIEATKQKIEMKKNEIMTNNANQKLENISKKVEKLALSLCSKVENPDEIKENLHDEIAKRKKMYPDESEKQSRTITSIQMKKVIQEKGNIKDFKIVIPQLQEILNLDFEQAVRLVEDNLISKKKYDLAEEICSYYFETGDKKVRNCMVNFNKLINISRIRDIFLKTLDMGDGTKTDENLKLIEKYMKEYGIKKSDVSLGKNCDGFKKITLEDVWVSEAESKEEFIK